MEIGPLPDSFPESFFVSDAQDDQTGFKVVIAYDDLAAGQQAMRLLARLGREESQHVSFQTQPWRFDLLADADWAQFAAGDAIKADLLVISTSRQSDLPPAVHDWLTVCLARKRGTSAAVVALLGSEGRLDTADSSRLEFVQSAANRAGLEFFAPPATGQDASPPVHCETERRARVARTLEESRPSDALQLGEVAHLSSAQAFNQVTPYSHWGINE